MIRQINNNNNRLIISHIEDADGMGSVVLANVYFKGNIDYILAVIPEVSSILKEDLSKYEEIFICDLPLDKKAIEVLLNNEKLQKKVKHFDHHASELENNKYSFVNEAVDINGKLTSGTELFYNYLLSIDNVLSNDFYKEFVESTRSADVWDLQSNFYDMGINLGTILNILGPKAYINIFSNYVIKEHFYLEDLYIDILNSAKENRDNYVKECISNVIITEYKNYKIGVVVSEDYCSFVGNAIAKKYIDSIDFALIINLHLMKCSLRCVKDDIDLGKVASEFESSGGGHKKAAGFYINAECMDIIMKFVNEYINSKKNKN